MTTGMLLATCLRRWYVVVACLVLTAAVQYAVLTKPGVYWAQVDVVFLGPASERFPNAIERSSGSIIAVAGLVAAETNKGMQGSATSSSGTTLAGEGVRDGFMVRLPNSGGQYENNFERPVLDVQVIGPDESEVRRRLDVLVGEVDETLVRLQRDDGVEPSQYITTQSAPAGAQVFYLNGRPARAAFVAGLMGVLLTLLVTVGVDRLAVRLRRSR